MNYYNILTFNCTVIIAFIVALLSEYKKPVIFIDSHRQKEVNSIGYIIKLEE